MIQAWPTIDNRVRVFKEEGGPVDEVFTMEGDFIFRRQKDNLLYMFTKWETYPTLRFYVSKSKMALEFERRRIQEADKKNTLVIMDAYCFYMQGGDVTNPRLKGQPC